MSEYLSTAQQIEEFMEGNIWHDCLIEIRAWIEDINLIMGETNDPEEWRRCQGRLEALREMLNLPDRLTLILEEEKSAKEESD